MERQHNKPRRMPAPAKINGRFSLLVIALFAALVLGGYFLQESGGTMVVAIIFAAAWAGLLVWSLQKAQWLPLLVSTAYWLITSAIRLFLRDGETTGREVSGSVEKLADFAATPLLPMNTIHPDLTLLAMAALTLMSLMGLIMILDKNKPKSENRRDGSSDQTDWF